MKNEIPLSQLRSSVSRILGEPIDEEFFNRMLAAFAANVNRRGLYSKQAVYKAVKRGWMSPPMARLFKAYAAE